MASEKRLIDANKLNAVLQNIAEHLTENGDALIAACLIQCQEVVERQRTLDAVEVVRCGACKNWTEIEETGGAGYCQHPRWTIAGEVPPIVQFADFCSYGERKDNG